MLGGSFLFGGGMLEAVLDVAAWKSLRKKIGGERTSGASSTKTSPTVR